MDADPFQIDTRNLCPHLQKILNINYTLSDAIVI